MWFAVGVDPVCGYVHAALAELGCHCCGWVGGSLGSNECSKQIEGDSDAHCPILRYQRLENTDTGVVSR